MNRLCRIDGCQQQARPQRTICEAHRTRLRRHGDPHFSRRHTLNEAEVDLIVSDPRPAAGLTLAERQEIAARLTERGWSAERIAQVVGSSPRTVERWRSKTRASRPLAA